MQHPALKFLKIFPKQSIPVSMPNVDYPSAIPIENPIL